MAKREHREIIALSTILSLIFPRDNGCLRGNEIRDERDGHLPSAPVEAIRAVLDYKPHKYS